MYDYVTDILKFPAVGLIDFSVEGVAVNASGFGAVRAAMADGRITMELDKTIKPSEAGYDTQNNRFVFPNEDLPRMLLEQALVVHEAVHAICDITGKQIDGPLSETVAFLAQGLFVYYFMKPTFDDDPSHWPFGDGVLKVAFEAGKPLRNRCATDLKRAEVADLTSHILGMEKYETLGKVTVPYNGL